MNAGTFPKPNFGASQYISSIPQPTDVREDVVRIDHAITPKLQLMGHYLHDAVTTAFYPPLWQGATYPTVGTTMGNPSWSAIVKLTQTISPNVLNETAFLYSGNTIHSCSRRSCRIFVYPARRLDGHQLLPARQ